MAEELKNEKKPQDEWYDKARRVESLGELVDFGRELLNGNTLFGEAQVHAISAFTLAAACYAADKHDALTNWQAYNVMWNFIRQWNHGDNKCGMRLVDYDDMLYPQYRDNFEKTLSPGVWKSLQEEARKKLATSGHAHPAVVAHWKNIAEGIPPFGYTLKGEDNN